LLDCRTMERLLLVAWLGALVCGDPIGPERVLGALPVVWGAMVLLRHLREVG